MIRITVRLLCAAGLLCGLGGIASAQDLSATIPDFIPEPQLPPSAWVLRSDAAASEASLTSAQATGPVTLTGTESRVLVDRRWVLSPPYAIAVTLRLKGAQASGGLGLGLQPGLESGASGTFWVTSVDGTVALERREGGFVTSRTVRSIERPPDARDTVRLTALVSESQVAFGEGDITVLTAPLTAVAGQGTPGVWMSGGDVDIESFEVLVPDEAVAQ